jgi:hypothetical protein
MKRVLVFVFFVFLAVPCFGAWTVRYVVPGGAGAKDGTTEAKAWDITDALTYCAANTCADFQINVKAGLYTLAADLTFGGYAATVPSTTAPIWWRGYKTTIGDLDDIVTLTRVQQTDLPRIYADTVSDQVIISGVHQTFTGIAFSGVTTDADGLLSITGGNIRFVGCQLENTQANSASNVFRAKTAGPVNFYYCRIKATTTAAINARMDITGAMDHCWITGGIIGLQLGAYSTLSHCVLDGYTTTGISCAAAAGLFTIDFCNFYGTTSTAISIGTVPTTGHVSITNCLFSGLTGAGTAMTTAISAASATNGVTAWSNQFWNVTTRQINLAENADVSDMSAAMKISSASAFPWTTGGSDYNLVAGASARNTAAPLALPFMSTDAGGSPGTGYSDIGALRHVDPSSTGGANFISSLMWFAPIPFAALIVFRKRR